MRCAAVVLLVLALGACSKKSDKPQNASGAGADAAPGSDFGGGSFANGTATDGAAPIADAGHTFAK